MFELLDITGTLVFAISGALTAIYKKLDLFGVYCIAFVTALGGGTVRDVMIGRTPVGWMLDIDYVYIINLGFFLSVVFEIHLPTPDHALRRSFCGLHRVRVDWCK